MTFDDVRVSYVVYLEAERVLQVIAWLLVRQARHHSGPLCNVYDLKVAGFGQCAGDFINLPGGRHPVSLPAQVKLAERADVTEFTDAHVAVVVR